MRTDLFYKIRIRRMRIFLGFVTRLKDTFNEFIFVAESQCVTSSYCKALRDPVSREF